MMYIYNLTTNTNLAGPGNTTFPAREVKYVTVTEGYETSGEFITSVLPKYRGIPILIELAIAKAMLVKRIYMPREECWVLSYQNEIPVVSVYDLANTIPDNRILGLNLISNPMVARDRLVREFVDTYVAYLSSAELNACKLYIHGHLKAGDLADYLLCDKTKLKYFRSVLSACKVKI